MIEENEEEIYVGHLFKNKGNGKTEAAGSVSSADHEKLQEIVNHLVKLPEEEPAVKPTKITRITHHEINAMRVTQSKIPAMKVEQKNKSKSLIQTFDAFMGLFKHQEKRSRCLVDGHECKHCGQIVKVAEGSEVPRGH